jgi:hypothetical protein
MTSGIAPASMDVRIPADKSTALCAYVENHQLDIGLNSKKRLPKILTFGIYFVECRISFDDDTFLHHLFGTEKSANHTSFCAGIVRNGRPKASFERKTTHWT